MKRMFHAFGLLLAGCLLSPEGSAQAVHYAGKVVDEAGKGLPGASVQIDGTPATATSDADGAFDLSTTITAGVRPRTPMLALAGASPTAFTGSAITFRAPEGLLLRGDGRALPVSASAASPVTAPLAKTAAENSAAAAYVLSVSKAGYVTRKYSQTKTTSLTLSLSLTKRPDSAGGYQVEKKLCMDESNRYRATLGLAPVAWSTALEAYADEGAKYDAARNKAHAHFGAVKPNPADAENEIPGWPLSSYKTISAVVTDGVKMMWDEGPGGGHYENIKGSHTVMGCGIHVTEAGAVWIIQDFK